jgi:hypothetical protein
VLRVRRDAVESSRNRFKLKIVSCSVARLEGAFVVRRKECVEVLGSDVALGAGERVPETQNYEFETEWIESFESHKIKDLKGGIGSGKLRVRGGKEGCTWAFGPWEQPGRWWERLQP